MVVKNGKTSSFGLLSYDFWLVIKKNIDKCKNL